jgi:L-alanine-DL-glutamate epimerase-like enolase superfamily enzyme
MLRHLDVADDRFGLSTPFRISRGVKTAADVVTVTIAEGHVTGRGEAVPYARYGEGIEDTIAAIRAIAPALADGACRRDLATLLPAGAARNAIDCALWDLESRLVGRSVAALAGLPEPVALPSAITIGLDTPDAMARAAARVASVPLLKIKVDRSDPAAQIAAVRAAAPSPRLIVDPNESWTIDTLQALKPHLLDWRVDLLEQPLPAGEDGALAQFDSPVPIAADEALHTAADLDRLAGRYDVVNIKLDKTGGLTEALVLARRAREKGFGLMVGCMVCSSLGIAPAMLLGAHATFVDLDGPLWLSEDRPGGVTDDNGMLSPAAPGFWGN